MRERLEEWIASKNWGKLNQCIVSVILIKVEKKKKSRRPNCTTKPNLDDNNQAKKQPTDHWANISAHRFSVLIIDNYWQCHNRLHKPSFIPRNIYCFNKNVSIKKSLYLYWSFPFFFFFSGILRYILKCFQREQKTKKKCLFLLALSVYLVKYSLFFLSFFVAINEPKGIVRGISNHRHWYPCDSVYSFFCTFLFLSFCFLFFAL